MMKDLWRFPYISARVRYQKEEAGKQKDSEVAKI